MLGFFGDLADEVFRQMNTMEFGALDLQDRPSRE